MNEGILQCEYSECAIFSSTLNVDNFSFIIANSCALNVDSFNLHGTVVGSALLFNSENMVVLGSITTDGNGYGPAQGPGNGTSSYST